MNFFKKCKVVILTLAIYLTHGLSVSAATIIDSTEGHTALLGTGFDSLTNDFTENRCVRFDEAQSRDFSPSTMSQGNLTVGSNLSAEEIKNYIYGSINASYPIFPGVNLSAEIEFERDFAQSDFTQTVTILYRGSSTSVVGEGYGMVIGEGPYRVLQNDSLTMEQRTQILRSMCGDRFVKGIESGIVFIATLQIKFDSEYDKRMIGGTLVLELFKMSGALADLAESLAKIEFTISGGSTSTHMGVSINLNVYQHGGYPERLLSLLPEPHLPQSLVPGRAISCSYENREMCFRTFVDLLNYASVDLPDQLESIDGSSLAPLSYLLEEYEHPDLEMLGFSAEELGALDQEANELSAIREQITSQLNRAIQDKTLVRVQLNKYGNPVPPREILYDAVSFLAENHFSLSGEDYYNALYQSIISHPQIHSGQISKSLEETKTKIHQRENALQAAFDLCFDKQNTARCRATFEEIIQRIQSGDLAYDETMLRIMPTDFEIWCRMTAQSGSLTDNERRTTLALMDALEFDNWVQDCRDLREEQEAEDEEAASGESEATDAEDSVSTEQEEKLNYFRDYGCACSQINNRLYNIDSYDLSNRGLTSVRPLLSLPYVKTLNLSGNNLTNQSIQSLVWLGIIRELDLSDNLIEDLSPFVDQIVPRTALDLRNIICETINDGDGYPKPVLEYDVYQELMNKLGSDYCSRLDQPYGNQSWTTFLKLRGNRITDISALADEDWPWDNVDLSENYIQTLKPFIKPLDLRSLNLSHNQLSAVGNFDIGRNDGVFNLYMENTRIHDCPFTQTEEQSCVF